MPNKPAVEDGGPVPVFTDAELKRLLGEAFTASCYPASGPLSDNRLGYLRGFAKALLDELFAKDVANGHFTATEVVAMLTGAALAAQYLGADYGK